MRSLTAIILIIISIVFSTLLSPSNTYIIKALLYLHPNIDDYNLFYNRVVVANEPKPWPVAENYNTQPIPQNILNSQKDLNTIAFVVIKDSELLFEHYWDGYGETSHSNSFSMAKSIVSLLMGIAIDEGYIKSVDQNVSDFIKEFDKFENKNITIKDLLTMSACLVCNEVYSALFSPTTKSSYG